VNLPTPSDALLQLFPPGVLACELRGTGDPGRLLPEEADSVQRAVTGRRQEFAAGRECARYLLAEFGIIDFPVKMADDRQPLWPAGMTGSITHTSDFCAAVAAPTSCLKAIGLDCEVEGRVREELWRHVCTPSESEWLRSLPSTEQPLAATLIFSAKEAFYKFQYPLTGERLNFKDAHVDVLEWGAPSGAFEVHACKRMLLHSHAGLPLPGQFRFYEGLILTGMALPAPAQ
jgi:4'-phosphopantetheinyl transferase EntD